MVKRKQILFILLLVPFFVFLTSSQEKPSSNVMDFLGRSVNFIILFGALAYFLYKPLRSFFDKRTREIEEAIQESEESRKEAEEKLREMEIRVAGLEEEMTKIKKDAEALGLKEKSRIQRLAQQEGERIKRLAQREIELEVKARIQELKEYTTELAAALTQERIKEKLTPEDHSLLIDKSIKRLVKLYEKSNSDQKIHPGTR